MRLFRSTKPLLSGGFFLPPLLAAEDERDLD
jgi:hypothetical protein